MNQTTYTHCKERARGLRVWIEGQKLALAGFCPDAPYTALYDGIAKRIDLRLDPEGARRVAKSQRNGVARPIIDLTGKQVASVFDGGEKLRVTFEHGHIAIEQHHEAQSQDDREKRFRQRSTSGTLQKASMFTGGGVSTEAIAEAFSSTGLSAKLSWVCECETKYIEAAGQNCLAIDDDTAFLVGMAEEIEPHLFTQVDVLSFSMPCAGFSTAGKAKHKQTSEQHSGTALFGVINAIKNSNPAVIISENVVEAQGSPIYQLLVAELERTGYRVFEQVLDQRHTATIEKRARYWLVAVSEGIAPDSLELPEIVQNRPAIASILEANHGEEWSANEYLRAKEQRDIAAGKGFRRQLLTGFEDSCGTIGRFYSKKRSTEPFVVNAEGLERLFSPVEHARVKSIPERLTRHMSKTTAHEVLGQSVDYRQPLYLATALLKAMGLGRGIEQKELFAA
jgi:DNA (cytosine-5)-methyltransferase 1